MIIKGESRTRVLSAFAAICLISGPTILSFLATHNVLATCTTSNGITTCSEGATFNVRINDILTVSITRPNTWASGAINTLLTNKVSISVASNNPAGFTATMKSASATPSLISQTDSSYAIPTLSAETSVAAFGANKWGYNIVESGGVAPTSYLGMVGSGDSPIIVSSSDSMGTEVRDVYFAAKADNNVVAGTYVNNVVVSVVSGVITTDEDESDDNPVTPVNPITPEDDTANDGDTTETTRGNSSTGTSVVATTTTSDTTTTTTTTESYAKPHGVTEKTADFNTIEEGTPLATGLAVTAGVSAAVGLAFFVAAKRSSRQDDSDDGYEDY